ncbi:hypothetical protein S83_019414, partial [Arachis hypogaea]
LQRSGKSCSLRWINYLRPDLKFGIFLLLLFSLQPQFRCNMPHSVAKQNASTSEFRYHCTLKLSFLIQILVTVNS